MSISLNDDNQDQLPPAIFLMGPTASGKTDLAVSLFEKLDCEIVSVDSALIYKGMDIGTAKPDSDLLSRAPHSLIDIREAWESYSVADFYQDAISEMDRISALGKVPLLVGGTMMYFRVLRDGIAALPSADQKVRDQINLDADKYGWPFVHDQLTQVDPEAAARIKPNDSQRLQRALEVYRVSGKSMTDYWRDQAVAKERLDASHTRENTTGNAENSDYTKLSDDFASEENSQSFGGAALPGVPYKIISLAIAPQQRSVLHERIEKRFELMLQNGFIEEVEGLRANPEIERNMPSMRCVGYRQIWDYLVGDVDFPTMQYKGVVATRQLAKRQLTWLRQWQELNWLESHDEKVMDKALKIIGKDAH